MGMTEILLILAVALVVIGPKKLPELARVLGRGLAEFRKATDDIQKTIYREVHKPLDPEQFVSDLESDQAQVKPGPPPGEKPAGTAAEDRPPAADEPSPNRGEEGRG
jgi:TatA/E family protein of Tat protein translocase